MREKTGATVRLNRRPYVSIERCYGRMSECLQEDAFRRSIFPYPLSLGLLFVLTMGLQLVAVHFKCEIKRELRQGVDGVPVSSLIFHLCCLRLRCHVAEVARMLTVHVSGGVRSDLSFGPHLHDGCIALLDPGAN